MKLSEAIRLGAMLKPQITNGSTRTTDGSCALGAALDAIGVVAGHARAVCHFPITLSLAVHPVTSKPAMMVLSVVRELNDHHRWTRERIADWVETVEAAQAHTQPASVAAVARVDHDQLVLTPRV